MEQLLILAQQQGLNISELAEKAGTSRATIYALKKNPSQDIFQSTIEKLARAVHVNPTSLTTETPNYGNIQSPNDEPHPNDAAQQFTQILEKLDELKRSYAEATPNNTLNQILVKLDEIEQTRTETPPPAKPSSTQQKIMALVYTLSKQDAYRALEILRLTFNQLA